MSESDEKRDHTGEADDKQAGPNHAAKPDLSTLAADAAHPFDQTNGIIEGLEGDADDPEQVNERLGENTAGGSFLTPGSATNPDSEQSEE